MKPSIEVTLARNTEGVVHVEFTVYNPTDIPAIDGELTLQICDQCKFAKDPTGFKHLPGQLDTQRIMLFDRLLPTTAFPIMSADIIVLDRINRFPIGMWPRCRTCVVRAPSEGIVHIGPTAVGLATLQQSTRGKQK